MGSNHDSELDQMIDGALSGYSEAEPLAGLEQRVVNRIRIAETRRKRFWFWGFAVTVAAALLVMVAVSVQTDRHPAPSVAIVEALPKPPIVTYPPPSPRKAVRRVHRSRSMPNQRQFPLMTPLTAEERALIALVNYRGAEVVSRSVDGPIEIQPIEIKPLQIDGSQ